MKSRDTSNPGGKPAWPDDGDDLIAPSTMLQVPDHLRLEDEDADVGDTVRVPNITRMPDGMEVVEEHLGHASAQWILEVRCDCGRRWFELEEITTARCPRCDTLVRIKVE